MIDRRVVRVGDMHPTRVLEVVVQGDGDAIIKITEDGSLIEEGHAHGVPRISTIEFCVSGGRSRHTVTALHALFEAMEKDNAERPLKI